MLNFSFYLDFSNSTSCPSSNTVTLGVNIASRITRGPNTPALTFIIYYVGRTNSHHVSTDLVRIIATAQ
jgi:hypothetical protein